MQSIEPHSNQFTASTLERVLSAAGVLLGSAGVFVVAYFNPAEGGFFPVCLLYATTGLHCPGCGLTRGFHALFRGDVLGALHYNALLPVYVAAAAYFGLALLLVAVHGRGLSFKFFKPWMVYAFLAALVVFAVLRNLPYYPFTLLAP